MHASIISCMQDIRTSSHLVPVEDDAPLLDRLRHLILSGDYEPGSLLPEQFLSQAFDVSRTPIREALKQLENEGLVEIRPRVGTFVRKPSSREIVELFQLKEGLEGLAAGLFTRRGEIPELAILRENVAASAHAANTDDHEGYARLVHEFHNTLVTGSDNQKLIDHYQRLMNQLAYHRLVLKAIDNPGRILISQREHENVLARIEAKDHIGAELEMRHHVEASGNAVFRNSSIFRASNASVDAE